jgi:hypothetical protein
MAFALPLKGLPPDKFHALTVEGYWRKSHADPRPSTGD